MAATDEEENGGGSPAVRKNAFSGLKRTAEGQSTPINAEDIDRRPFGVLVDGFKGKRSRTNADCHGQGDSLSTATNVGLCAVADDLRRRTIDDEDCEVKSTDTPTYASYRIAALDVEPKINLLEVIKPSPDSAENSLTDSPPREEVKEMKNGNDSNSDCDDVSEISGLSDLSMEGRWNSSAGMVSWVDNQIAQGTNPRAVLGSLVPSDAEIPDDLDDETLWRLIVSIISEPPRRKKLDNITTFESVLHLLRNCKKIIVLTGAGVSVSCGIPDFRSRDGIYARLAVDYPDLPDPQAMFDIKYFKRNPRPFFKFAKEIYPGQFQPSLSHRFIGHLESCKRLLRNYTQNIDTLELAAGITRVVQCHGSFAGATCMVCKHKVDAEAIRDNIMNQVIPRCCRCSTEEELAILKPDIVFFGESLSKEFHQQIELDKDECDLLIVIGSSLKVRPVAIIPRIIAANVPQVLINRESLRHLNFDVELLGDCDVIINELCHLLDDGFKSLCSTKEPSIQITREELNLPTPFCSDSDVQKPDDGMTPEISHLPESEDPSVDDSRTEVVFDHCHKHASLPIKVSSYLKENTYLYCPPRQYVFCGAEVYKEDSLDGDSDSSSVSSGVVEDGDEFPKDRSFSSPQDHGLDELGFSSSGVKTADAATDERF